MKNLIKSLIGFISSLNFIDVVFLTSILILIILIVVMIYIMRIEEDEKGEIIEDRVIPTEDILELQSISKEIDNMDKKTIELTPYEEEQEERAIISYDELISNTGRIKLNYEEENDDDGLMVKKVDMETLNVQDLDLPKLAVEDIKPAPIISYEKEEEFLRTLKKMQSYM